MIREAAELQTNPEEQKTTILMEEAHQKGALANQTAAALTSELKRAMKVSRGEASTHFLATATSGTWGRWLEWKAMGWSFVLFAVFLLVGIIVARLFRSKYNLAEHDFGVKAGGIAVLITFSISAYYLFHFVKAIC